MKILLLLLCFLQTHAITGSIGYKRSLGHTNLALYFNCDIAKNPGIAMIYECPIYPNLSFFGGINALFLKQTWQVTFGVMLHYNGAAVAGYNGLLSHAENVAPDPIGTKVSHSGVLKFANLPDKISQLFSFTQDSQGKISYGLMHYSYSYNNYEDVHRRRYINSTRIPIINSYSNYDIYQQFFYNWFLERKKNRIQFEIDELKTQINEKEKYMALLKENPCLPEQMNRLEGQKQELTKTLNEKSTQFNNFNSIFSPQLKEDEPKRLANEKLEIKTSLIDKLWSQTLGIFRKSKKSFCDEKTGIWIQNNIEIEKWINDIYASSNDMPAPAFTADTTQEIIDQFMYKCLAEAWHFNRYTSESNAAFKAIIGKHPFDSKENIEKNIDESLDFAARAFIYFTKIEYKDDKRLDCSFTNNIFVQLVDELKKKQESLRVDYEYPISITELLQETVARVDNKSAFFRFLNKTP